MKEITKKVLEAGLIDKHAAALMERWGMIDHGDAEIVGTNDVKNMSKDQLQSFTDDLATLIEKDNDAFRQTRLDIPVTKMKAIDIEVSDGHFITVPVTVDEMGRFIMQHSEPVQIRRGMLFRDVRTGEEGTILEYEDLYQGEDKYAVLLTVGEQS